MCAIIWSVPQLLYYSTDSKYNMKEAFRRLCCPRRTERSSTNACQNETKKHFCKYQPPFRPRKTHITFPLLQSCAAKHEGKNNDKQWRRSRSSTTGSNIPGQYINQIVRIKFRVEALACKIGNKVDSENIGEACSHYAVKT